MSVLDPGREPLKSPHAKACADRALSRVVLSNQQGMHPRLDTVVRKHLATVHRKPPAPYSVEAMAQWLARWDGQAALVLDSACGTGESTVLLARRHPKALVVGVDQSLERLGRGQRKLASQAPDNLLLLRADVTDLWALMHARGMVLSHHYLLYPNPWPKSEHLLRRWGGHPRLPDLIGLGGRLTLRTNWETYAREFARALELAGRQSDLRPCPVQPEAALTPFERKYAASGHALWELQADLRQGGLQAGNTPVDR